MISKLNIQDKTHDEILQFVFKTSPYSTPKTKKFTEIIDKVMNDKHYTHVESMGEVDTKDNIKKVKYFLVWKSFDNKTMFSGTAFIPYNEINQGLVLQNYEPKE